MKYIICGLEHVGLRLAEALLDLNEELTVITLHQNESSLFFIRERLTNYVEGDARNGQVLKKAGIENADYLIIFTSNEIKNIEINCKAKELHPQIKTALLINNISYHKIVEKGFEVDFVFHLPSIVSLPIVSACIDKNILYILQHKKESHFFGSITCHEHSPVKGRTIKEIETSNDIKINCHFNGEKNPYKFSNDTVINSGAIIYSTMNRDHISIDNLKDTLTPGIDLLSETYKHIRSFKIFSIPPGVRKVILLYALLIFLSVVIFKLFMEISIIDSLYFVITTTTTVGYGDFNLMQAPIWLKIYGSIIMLAGAALLATLFSVITDNIISKRLGGYLNYTNRKIKDHVIVAGMGSIGVGVANCLSEMGIKTVAIEKNPDNSYMQALKGKLPLLIGDASDSRILVKAGIKKAKTLASLIDDDLNNVNIILKGNSLNNDLHTVARIFSHELNKKARSAFQIDNVISASSIAVPYILCNLIHKNVLWAGYLHNEIYAIYLIDLCKHNFPADLNRLRLISEFSINPLLLKRNGSILQITEHTIFFKDDHLYVFSDYKSLVRAFSK